jgi:hypothetical protein
LDNQGELRITLAHVVDHLVGNVREKQSEFVTGGAITKLSAFGPASTSTPEWLADPICRHKRPNRLPLNSSCLEPNDLLDVLKVLHRIA